MAELVDALVSNTSGFTSMPVRSRLWVLKKSLIIMMIIRLFNSIRHNKSMLNSHNKNNIYFNCLQVFIF